MMVPEGVAVMEGFVLDFVLDLVVWTTHPRNFLTE